MKLTEDLEEKRKIDIQNKRMSPSVLNFLLCED
jgi:hypothetical protein